MMLLCWLAQLLADVAWSLTWSLLQHTRLVLTQSWYCDHCDTYHLPSTRRWYLSLRVDGWHATTRPLADSASCCWRGTLNLRRGSWTPESTNFDRLLAKVIGPSVR